MEGGGCISAGEKCRGKKLGRGEEKIQDSAMSGFSLLRQTLKEILECGFEVLQIPAIIIIY